MGGGRLTGGSPHSASPPDGTHEVKNLPPKPMVSCVDTRDFGYVVVPVEPDEWRALAVTHADGGCKLVALGAEVGRIKLGRDNQHWQLALIHMRTRLTSGCRFPIVTIVFVRGAL